MIGKRAILLRIDNEVYDTYENEDRRKERLEKGRKEDGLT